MSQQLYEQSVLLHKQGYGSRRISKLLGVPEKRKLIEGWIYGGHKPRSEPNLNATPELAYLIGAFLGDGWLYHGNDRGYWIKLQVRDHDFAKQFWYCLSKVSRRKVSFLKTSRGIWVVSVSSKPLYLFLQSDLDVFERTTKLYPADFIRSFSDAEGSIHKLSKKGRNKKYLRIQIANKNLERLEFISNLLSQYFGIASRINVNRKPGYEDCYRLSIAKQKDVAKFAKFIGFTIKRKAAVLNSAQLPVEVRLT